MTFKKHIGIASLIGLMLAAVFSADLSIEEVIVTGMKRDVMQRT